jgi:hypothetical protein
MGRVAALLAGEFRPAFPVGPLRVAALAAPLRRKGRVNKKDGNTRPLRLVGDELAQLQERPAFQPVPLAFSNPYPPANVLEVFNRNGAVGAFSQQNYLLGNHMITVASE